MNHLDDDAELYALGLTDRERDAEIEAHLAACEPCRARVVAAEEAGASLAAALPPARPAAPRRARWAAVAAMAAAIALAATAAFEASSARSATSQLARADTALGAIAASHFAHTTLAADRDVVAKALYARDGSWCYVLVSGAPRGAHVLLRRGTSVRDAGALEDGTPATLFVRDSGPLDEIDVVTHERVLAHGRPVF